MASTLTERLLRAAQAADILRASTAAASVELSTLDGNVNGGGGGGGNGSVSIGAGGTGGTTGGGTTIGPSGTGGFGGPRTSIGPGGINNVGLGALVTIGPGGVSRDAEYIAKAVIGAVGGLSKALSGDGGLGLRSGSGL